MSDGLELIHYFRAQAEVREAQQDRERASIKLDMARIWCRFQEIQSQADPLNQIIEDSGVDADSNYCKTLRALMIAGARYVVTGKVDLD